MLQYIVKRILIFLPTLLVISFLAFGLSQCTPGDPVEETMAVGEKGFISREAYDRNYRQLAHQMGLDRPVFYLSLSALAYPDTLHRIVRKDQRENLLKLIAHYGNWEQISTYYNQIQELDRQLTKLPDSLKMLNRVRSELLLLNLNDKDRSIQTKLDSIDHFLQQDALLNARIGGEVDQLKRSYSQIKSQQTPWKLKVPVIHWYGLQNQYHFWISNFLKGDFGVSYRDKQPVANQLKTAIPLTLMINGLAIFFAYLIAVPIGVYSAKYKDRAFDRITLVLLFMLHSLPVFWIATMLIAFFSTPEYGFDWFPTYGLGNLPDSAPFWQRFWETAYHLVLPIFSLTYGAIAFLSRQMRGGLINILGLDYIRTARAKGVNEHQVIWKHGFRNALFPIITLFASVLPAAISGSVVIEVIFSIPGMGKTTVDAINAQDWPVIYTILMIASVMTVLGILIADLLYALADPRVKFNKQ
ncbi:MAG: hypothetical protein DHS20C18_13190 [Saprospiraceae bacterium]|nr:MAG: hypothetical protein DHS20C18_13190 [Saprospiraceae bacterium]